MCVDGIEWGVGEGDKSVWEGEQGKGGRVNDAIEDSCFSRVVYK